MKREDLRRIPSSAIKELSDKYEKIKIIDCIYAHDKIVYNSKLFDMTNLTNADTKKRFMSQKFDFKSLNNEIISIQHTNY